MKKATLISLAVIVALVAQVIPAMGQEKQPAKGTSDERYIGMTPNLGKEEQLRKVIELKYTDPDAVAHLLSMFGASLVTDRRTKVLTVVGPASAVAAIEEAVKKLDVPPPPLKEVELTAYFLVATRQPSEAPDLPSELHEVVSQLKKVLNYQTFHLLNTALIRTRDDEGASVSGFVNGGGGSQMDSFKLSFRRLNVILEGKTPIVRIGGLSLNLRGQAAAHEEGVIRVREAPEAVIQTNIDLPEGQKVVVGRTAFESANDAFVLVLTAKVLD